MHSSRAVVFSREQQDRQHQGNQPERITDPAPQLYTKYGGGGKTMFTLVHMENNNNNTKINSVFRILTTANLLLPHTVYCQYKESTDFNN